MKIFASVQSSSLEELEELEDSRIFFEISTGHSVPDWNLISTEGGVNVYGGICKRCGAAVRSDVDRDAAESECTLRRVDVVHTS